MAKSDMIIVNAVNVNYNCLEDNFIFRNRVHRSVAEVCPEGCHPASDVCKTSKNGHLCLNQCHKYIDHYTAYRALRRPAGRHSAYSQGIRNLTA